MSHNDRYSRHFKLGLILPCLTYFLICGASSVVAMQRETPLESENRQSDEVAGQVTQAPAQFSDVHVFMLQQEIKELSSITKELREAQERIDARIFAIESRLNSETPTLTPVSSHRLWRSTEGKTIIATLTQVNPDNVVLTRNGKQATIPLKHLCTADREYVAAQAQRIPEKDIQRADIRELGIIR